MVENRKNRGEIWAFGLKKKEKMYFCPKCSNFGHHQGFKFWVLKLCPEAM